MILFRVLFLGLYFLGTLDAPPQSPLKTAHECCCKAGFCRCNHICPLKHSAKKNISRLPDKPGKNPVLKACGFGGDKVTSPVYSKEFSVPSLTGPLTLISQKFHGPSPLLLFPLRDLKLEKPPQLSPSFPF